jgi:hypothetical protein
VEEFIRSRIASFTRLDTDIQLATSLLSLPLSGEAWPVRLDANVEGEPDLMQGNWMAMAIPGQLLPTISL